MRKSGRGERKSGRVGEENRREEKRGHMSVKVTPSKVFLNTQVYRGIKNI